LIQGIITTEEEKGGEIIIPSSPIVKPVPRKQIESFFRKRQKPSTLRYQLEIRFLRNGN